MPHGGWQLGTRRWLMPALVLFGLLLVVPSWRMGFLADDYAHLAVVEGWSPVQTGFDLYMFVPRDPAQVEGLRHRNYLPGSRHPI